MNNNKPSRRREVSAIIVTLVICAAIGVGFLLIDTSDNKAPDVVTDSQRAVDSGTMAPQR